MPDQQLVHATCVCIGDIGVLIIGPSGSGKSSLAAQLILHGAQLVSDDQTILSCESDQLVARAPEKIRHKMELFGLGVVSLPDHCSDSAHIHLVLDAGACAVERMPCERYARYLGVDVPLRPVDVKDSASAARIVLYCQSIADKAQAGHELKQSGCA